MNSEPIPAHGEMELSIVLPCLNEAETLEACIQEAQAALRNAGIVGEIIVADNGSSDDSRAIAGALGARVVAVATRGYGSALRGGITAARGRFVLMGDADGSYDFREALRFVEKLREGWDLVMGNRFAGGIEEGAMPWKNRHLGNPVLSGLGRILFDAPCRDFHCGLRAFRKEAFIRLDLQTDGMEFASEMVIKAKLLGLRTAEIPIKLRRDGRKRPPHLRPWRDGWRHLRFMLLFSPRWLFLYPGVLAAAGGLVCGGALLSGPVRVHGVEFDVHTLLFCAVAVLLGAQSIAFAIMTKVYSIQAGLQPAPAREAAWLRWISLELGLAVGGMLALLGLGLSLGALAYWRAKGFGNLDPGGLLRWVIPGGTLLTLGMQTILVSFFLSILTLPLRR